MNARFAELQLLVTELQLAGASSIGEANSVLEQFLQRLNRRFRVPPQYTEPAFRPLDPKLCLEQILCFKHCRKVAKAKNGSITVGGRIVR